MSPRFLPVLRCFFCKHQSQEEIPEKLRIHSRIYINGCERLLLNRTLENSAETKKKESAISVFYRPIKLETNLLFYFFSIFFFWKKKSSPGIDLGNFDSSLGVIVNDNNNLIERGKKLLNPTWVSLSAERVKFGDEGKIALSYSSQLFDNAADGAPRGSR